MKAAGLSETPVTLPYKVSHPETQIFINSSKKKIELLQATKY